MNKIGKEMMTRDLLQFRFYTEEKLVRMYMDALEVIDNLQSKIDKAIEYITSYDSISTIQGLDDIEKNKELDEKTINIMVGRYLKVHHKLLNILEDDKIQEIPQFKGTMEQLDELCNIRKE